MKVLAIGSFFVCLLVLLFPSNAAACLCDATATVEKAFGETAAIFTGRYLGSEYRKGIENQFAEMEAERDPKKANYEVLVYRFEVARWWKGGTGRETILVTDHVRLADGSEIISDCDVGFETGRSYLIYAYGDEKEYGTGACTRTKSLKRARQDIAALKRLTAH